MAPIAAELAAAVLGKHHANPSSRHQTPSAATAGVLATKDSATAALSPPPPVSREALQQVADSLARGISDVKYQIEAHILAHFDEFSTQAHNAVAVLKDSRKLAEIVDELHRQIEDPVNGLSTRLRDAVREHKDAEREAEVVELSISVVQTIVEIQQLFSTYDDRLAANDYPGALAVMQQLGNAIRSLPPWNGVAVFNELVASHSATEADLANRLEYIISEALCLEFGKESVALKIQDTVSAQGLGPDPISLRTALAAISAQGLESSYLGPFVRMLFKRVLDPVVRDPRWEVDADGGHALRVTLNDSAPTTYAGCPEGLLYDRLDAVLMFLETTLGSDDAGVSFARPIFVLLGQTFWQQISDGIIRCYLEPAVPAEAKNLNSFSSVAKRSSQFEERAIALGMITAANRRLTIFCANLEHHFIERRRQTLLKTTRLLVTGTKYATVDIEEPQNVPLSTLLPGIPAFESSPEKMPQVKCLEGLFAFPRCVVSVAARDVVRLARRTLAEARTLSPYCKSQLHRSVHAMLDLFRAIVPVHGANRLATIPQMPMVFYNDCMYVAHALLALNWEYRGASSTSYLGLVVAYRELGERVLMEELKRQQENLKDIVDGADGLDVLDDRRRDIVERTLKQLSHQLTRLSHVWQPVFPTAMYQSTLRPLVTHTLDLLSAELLSLVDIGSAESATLHELLTGFAKGCVEPLLIAGKNENGKEGTANNKSSNSHDVQSQPLPRAYMRFAMLARILDASFAEVMEVFRGGGMKGLLSEAEVVGVVRALFADTPLRRANLEEIARRGREVL
ncbi:Centromere/kinetochore protein zw10 [Geranomyces michiganensis]|nr:Centromere/kinetochore protein zw10 [Geranomyces michiganensis]